MLCNNPLIGGITRLTNISCSCASGYKWSNSSQTCICADGAILLAGKCKACKEISNALHTSASATACNCAETFQWNITQSLCLCPTNSVIFLGKCRACDETIGASGVATPTSCTCSSPTNTWNSTTGVCACGSNTIKNYDGSCSSCTALDINTIGVTDKYNCKCKTPYFWDNIQRKCLDCSKANGKSRANDLTCSCGTGYIFDVFSNICVKKCTLTGTALINCLNCKMPQSSGNAIFLVAANTIILQDQSIITAQYSAMQTILKPYSSFQCACNSGYKWENYRKRCFKSA
jgi:hypothetical protein